MVVSDWPRGLAQHCCFLTLSLPVLSSLPRPPHPPAQMHLDVFKEDPEFAQHEEEYQAIKREILGDEEESEGEEESERERREGEGSSEEEESSEDDEATGGWAAGWVGRWGVRGSRAGRISH